MVEARCTSRPRDAWIAINLDLEAMWHADLYSHGQQLRCRVRVRMDKFRSGRLSVLYFRRASSPCRQPAGESRRRHICSTKQGREIAGSGHVGNVTRRLVASRRVPLTKESEWSCIGHLVIERRLRLPVVAHDGAVSAADLSALY